MIALMQRSLPQVEAGIASALQCIMDRSALNGAIAAEHIRSTLYAACALPRQSSGAAGVHSVRLLKNARRAVDLIRPSGRPTSGAPSELDFCSSILERLERLGDAAHVGQGQWIATPLRIVDPGGANDWMLLGSAPIAALQAAFTAPVACAGASRFINAKSLTKSEHRDLVQSVDDWLGPSPTLSSWTTQMLASYETRMEASPGLSAEQLELYAPDILRIQRKLGRWIAAGHVASAISGPRLCRPRGSFARAYNRPYFLAHFDFSDGKLSLRSSAPIAHELTLRLRFGFDLLLNMPRRFSISTTAQTLSIDLPTSLPEPESRVYALGWNDPTGPVPSERLTFRAHAMPFLLSALQRLSITPNIVRHTP
ncbi:hypothetical protein AB8B21_28140 [Tardiphaga sp. 866_E4_N2_1]|uniref:hypothetical protein n=1 Tax=unclassified Tardiphaga TaxID=2631404 RepID=UPI003F1F5066